MQRILDTVIFLGKQGIALCGHRESLADHEITNAGNFLEALKYLAQYDATLSAHLEKAKQHQNLLALKKGGKKGAKGRGTKLTFLSNDSQNNLIKVIGNAICEEIIGKLKNCRAWALIADTTPDVSHQEQLSICVRIVDFYGEITEHLLFCKRALGTTAQELFHTITEALKAKNVDFSKLVAQSYDGASSMSGCYNGLQAKIKESFGEHIVYIHCYAHRLNLVLSDTASAAIDVISLFGNLEKLYCLFNRSVQIHALFEHDQKDNGVKVLSLKRINTVCWSSCEHSLHVFLSRIDSIGRVLTKVATNVTLDSNQRDTANGLIDAFKKKEIIATALLFREIFSVTGPLSRYLQSVDIDIGKAVIITDSCLSQLQELRMTPESIITNVEKNYPLAEWKNTRRRKRKILPG